MIPEKLPWFKILLRFRGSILLRIWQRLLWTTLIAALLVWLHHDWGWFQSSLTPLPFTFIGLALSIFLGFRNSASYDRFWEGRKLWGSLVNTSRNLGREFQQLLQPPESQRACQRQAVYYVIAYVHALRCYLRGDAYETVQPLISNEDYQQLRQWHNPPLYLVQRLGEQLQQARRKGWIDVYHLPIIERHLSELVNIQGGCERIKSTPIPFAYIVLMHRLVAIYCFALPFGVIDSLGLYTPFVVGIVSYAFLGLDAIGDSIENPFALEDHDLPLSAISRTIEINLRQQLGETDVPEPPFPNEHGVLL